MARVLLARQLAKARDAKAASAPVPQPHAPSAMKTVDGPVTLALATLVVLAVVGVASVLGVPLAWLEAGAVAGLAMALGALLWADVAATLGHAPGGMCAAEGVR